MSQDHTDLGSSLTCSTPHMQQGVSVKEGHARGFVLSCGARLPLDLFFPCSVSHSPLPNKVELSAERGGLPDGSPSPSSYFATRLLFLFFFFFFPCACCHYLPHSLLNLSSHPSSSQSVTALLVTREASQGRCMRHLLQHMVHLLLRGAQGASASCSSMCACGHACVRGWLFSCPLKQGLRLMQFALT